MLICNKNFGQKKPSNASYIELSYALNTKWQLGKTIDVKAGVIKLKSDYTGNYVYLVRFNTTYRVKVLDKALYSLIKENDFLILRNCTRL